MSIAIIEEVIVKSSGRISLAVKCPFCQSRHFHDLGYIHKTYSYPCSIRHSVCASKLEVPYHLVIQKKQYPSVVIQYYSQYMTKDEYEDVLKDMLYTRLETM